MKSSLFPFCAWLLESIQAERQTVDIIVTVPFNRTDSFGEIYPFSRDYVEPALTWMNNRISEKYDEVEFNLTYKDSRCSKDGVALFWGDEFKPPRKNPLAFFGPVCQDAAVQAALSGKLFQIPILTPGYFGANNLRHKEQFPTLIRTLPGYEEAALFVRKLFETLGYIQTGCRHKIILVYEYDRTTYDSMVKFREALIHAVNYAFEEYGIRIDDFVAIEMVFDQQIFEYKLSKEVQERIKSDDDRPVSTIIIGHNDLAEQVLREAKNHGILNRALYDWFLIDLHGASTYLSHHWLDERNITAYDEEDLLMWSHLNVVTQFNDDSFATKLENRDFENFTESVLEEYELNDIEYPYNDAGTFPRAFADTLYVFYELWRAFSSKNSYEDRDAVPLINQIRSGFISNFFGEVMAFDENLQQFGKYQVLQFKPEIQKWKQTAIKTMIGECPDCKMGDIQIKDNHRFIEPLDCVGVASNTPPMIEDEYEEEYESQETEHFNTATWAGVIGAMIPTLVLVVVGSVLYWIYRKKKYAIVIVRSVSKSRRKPGKASAEPISSNKSSCKSNGPQDFDPTIQRLETNRMSEELHVQFQVQDCIENIEEIKPPKLQESKNFLKKNMKVLTSQKSEDSELFEEVCHSLTFDYH